MRHNPMGTEGSIVAKVRMSARQRLFEGQRLDRLLNGGLDNKGSRPMKRPNTPVNPERHMFYGNDHRPQSRPSTHGEKFRPSANNFLHGTAASILRSTRRSERDRANVPRPPTSSGYSTSKPPRASRISNEIKAAAANSHRRRIKTKVDRNSSHAQEMKQHWSECEKSFGKCLSSIRLHSKGLATNKIHPASEKALLQDLLDLYKVVDDSCSMSEQHADLVDIGDVNSLRRKALVALSPLVVEANVCITARLARVVLRLGINGCKLGLKELEEECNATLISSCRLLYTLSKKEENDELFLTEKVLESLLALLASAKQTKGDKISWAYSFDVMILATTILKFTSRNVKNRDWLGSQGAAISTLSTLLGVFSSPKREAAQVMVQLTGALRNLSRNKQFFKQFFQNNTLDRLCKLIPVYIDHTELMYNVARTLCALTGSRDFRASINNSKSTVRQANLRNFIKMCSVHSSHNAMLIRVLFILGNLTTSNGDNRRMLVLRLKALPTLGSILTRATGELLNPKKSKSKSKSAKEKAASEISELLVKLVRVLANLSIHEEVGPLVARSNVVGSLIEILESTEDVELLLNTLSAVTNMAFHTTQTSNPSIAKDRARISKKLISLLMHKHEEIVLESIRALGTFSQAANVRQLMQQFKGVEIVIVLLDHSHREIVFTACGVLVNFSGDAACKDLFDGTVVGKLIEILDDAIEDDASIALIVTKVLVNVAFANADVFDSEMATTLRDLLEPELDPVEEDDEENKEINEELQKAAIALLNVLKSVPDAQPKTKTVTKVSNLEPLH